MSKTFGYSKNSGKHWFVTDGYTDKEIENIKDPEGGNGTELPTAIPSPFARIDLVKTAFRNISRTPMLTYHEKEGAVIAGKEEEKLVSHTLDLAEMLFNMESLKDHLKIIVWDKALALQQLKKGSPVHTRLAETLELYLNQDRDAYNFDQVKRLYLIEYNHKIIGSTSPVTLFFPTANDLSHARIKLNNNYTTFDTEATPLYKRDVEFQKYLYLLFKAHPELTKSQKLFHDYLISNLNILNRLNHPLFSAINKLNPADFTTKFEELNAGSSGKVIEILNVFLRKRKKEDMIGALQSSDFIIISDKYKQNLKPLVLQNDFYKPFQYANDPWDASIKVPYAVAESQLEKRKLPGISIQYPYLTVSDFLEPYLIRLVYPIHGENFFDGNLIIEAGEDTKGYLLPLKKLFFDFYDSQDLMESMPGKPQIELIQGAAGSVKVVLKIPVKKDNEYITFERIYHSSSGLQTPEEDNNKGIIVEHQFGISLFPFLKTTNPSHSDSYRVQLVDRDIAGILKNTQYDLEFYTNTGNQTISKTGKTTRTSKSAIDMRAGSEYYVLEASFDFIRVTTKYSSDASGILIPKWKECGSGNESFSFSVDFGTTNSHIEYKVGNGSPKPFDITWSDLQVATLYDPIREKNEGHLAREGVIAISESIDFEFVPLLLGGNIPLDQQLPGVMFKFPQRTVMANSHDINFDTTNHTLADFNIPFTYEKRISKGHIEKNLKWAKKERGNDQRVRAFFEELIMLMRNKVLLNNGKLSETKLIWFYPSSMKPGRKAQLEGLWNELYQKYFNPNNSTIGITESLAPFYYFKGAKKITGGAYNPVVSIDIGGGTTDVVVFKSNKPLVQTSFKFAANTIFGDGFSEQGAADSNLLIGKYTSYFKKLLEINKHPDLTDVLKDVIQANRTEDINTFFFSIVNNPKIGDNKLYCYNTLLSKDEDLKIIFLYFYTAIVYHIAALMKYQGIELPNHLVFSGTGSKILNILTADFNILGQLSQHIFETVYQSPYEDNELKIEMEKFIPKEVTCKGGLMTDADELKMNVKDIGFILTGLEAQFPKGVAYDDLNEEAKLQLVSWVESFNTFFFQLNQHFDFRDYFNISEASWSLFKKEIGKNLREHLEQGLAYNAKQEEGKIENKALEETLFFYPLTGTINYLTSQLASLSAVND